MNAIRPFLPRRVGRDHGFTLIELMVAMLLGLVVIAGVTSVFLAGQQSFRTNNALGDVEDGSRIAFELMSRDIREAGQTGCDSASGRVANVLNNSSNNGGTDWWADWGNALHGYGGANSSGTDGDADQPDPAVTTGTGIGQRVAGTDSLEAISAGNLPVSVKGAPSQTAANFTLNATSSDLYSGEIIMVCSPDHAAMVQISNYNNNTVTVVHNSGNVVSPGNCAKGLGYPTSCANANGNPYVFPNNSTISAMQVSDWYIGNYNTTGGRSLYRIALVNSGGNAAVQAQEIVRNVTDMQITYLQNPNTSFVSAANVTDWSQVIAARVTLTVQSTFQRASVKATPISRTYSATTTVRNRVL